MGGRSPPPASFGSLGPDNSPDGNVLVAQAFQPVQKTLFFPLVPKLYLAMSKNRTLLGGRKAIVT